MIKWKKNEFKNSSCLERNPLKFTITATLAALVVLVGIVIAIQIYISSKGILFND